MMISHWDQEQFNVIVMSFKNSSSYVQRQTDRILRSHWDYAKVYMNNIIIFSRSLKDHLNHLKVIFELFASLWILLSSSKTFLNYSFIILLKQKMNDFDLVTTIEKLKTITKLWFSATLNELNIYLDLIKWLQNYVQSYAQIIKSLQRRKILLLKQVLKELSKFRKRTTTKICFVSTIFEMNVFEYLKEIFNKSSMLIHFVLNS